MTDVIRTIEQLDEYIARFTEDARSVSEEQLDISSISFDPIVIRISEGDESLSSTITTTWMNTFLKLQNQIYEIFNTIKQDKLTDSEKNLLEIRVKVEPGSTQYLVDIANLLKGALPQMSETQILSVAIPAVIVAIGISFMKHRSKINKDKLDAQVEMLRIEKESSAQTEQQKEETERLLGVVEIVRDVVDISSQAEKKMYKALSRQAEVADVSIDNEPMSAEELADLGRQSRRRVEKRIKLIEDSFKIAVVTFETRSGNTEVNLSNDEYDFKNVIIPDDLLTDEQLAIFEKAQHRDKIAMKLTVEDKEGVLSRPVLIGIEDIDSPLQLSSD